MAMRYITAAPEYRCCGMHNLHTVKQLKRSQATCTACALKYRRKRPKKSLVTVQDALQYMHPCVNASSEQCTTSHAQKATASAGCIAAVARGAADTAATCSMIVSWHKRNVCAVSIYFALMAMVTRVGSLCWPSTIPGTCMQQLGYKRGSVNGSNCARQWQRQ